MYKFSSRTTRSAVVPDSNLNDTPRKKNIFYDTWKMETIRARYEEMHLMLDSFMLQMEKGNENPNFSTLIFYLRP